MSLSAMSRLLEPERDSQAHQKQNSVRLPSSWIGYLWQHEPLLLAASAFMQLAWSSCMILGAYYFVNEMVQNKDQDEGLLLCLNYLATSIAIVIAYQYKELWAARMGIHIPSPTKTVARFDFNFQVPTSRIASQRAWLNTLYLVCLQAQLTSPWHSYLRLKTQTPFAKAPNDCGSSQPPYLNQ